jgi:hypothetical protein
MVSKVKVVTRVGKIGKQHKCKPTATAFMCASKEPQKAETTMDTIDGDYFRAHTRVCNAHLPEALASFLTMDGYGEFKFVSIKIAITGRDPYVFFHYNAEHPEKNVNTDELKELVPGAVVEASK